MEYNKICPICGKHFTANNDQYIYCGKDCKVIARRKRDRDAKSRIRAAASAERAKKREEHEQNRKKEAAERGLHSNADFERRIAEGDPRALMLREQAQHGNATKLYWQLFKQCTIAEAEAAGKASRTTVNGVSVYDDLFEDLVIKTINDGAATFLKNG